MHAVAVRTGPEAPVVSPARGSRIPELDGVRGLAIALVLIFHYVELPVATGARTLWGSTALFYGLFLPTRFMWSGVDLFFVLSGFLIGGILLDNRESPRYYSVFYLRRFHRIFPLYYLLIAVVAVGVWAWPLSPLFRGSMPMWVFPVFAQNLTGDYTRAPEAIEVTWSLAVEEQFYLLFPFIVKLCSRTALLYVLGACLVAAPVLRTLLILDGWGFELVYSLLPTRADTLALGVLAAMIVRSEAATTWVKVNARRLYLCLLGLIALVSTMLKWTDYSYLGTVGYSIFGTAHFLFILLLLIAPLPLMKAAFSARWLRWLGMVSYCVYLVHYPMKIGMFQLFMPGHDLVINGTKSLVVTIAALVTTLAVAQFSWVVLERPLVKRAHVRYQY